MKEEREITDSNDERNGWDVIVIDGTWSQARKMNSRISTNI